MRPKATIYIPCQQYGRFLEQAIASVVAQTASDWELLVVDDGSQDETASIAARFAAKYPQKIRLLKHPASRGLQACANTALEAARGEYFMRLDADDYLDENALLVLSSYLDRHPEAALVYPNYLYVDEAGKVLGVEQRKRIGEEAKLLDLPAHGACTMVRRRILKSIGGYSETTEVQDGYELWLKVMHRYPVANVSTPLFYYRQHSQEISRDQNRILSARSQIKRELAKRSQGKVKPRITAVVPAKNSYPEMPNIVLREFAGKPLIDWTLDAAREAQLFEQILVSADDPQVVAHCQGREGVITELRPADLSGPQVWYPQVLHHAVEVLEKGHQFFPDILILLNLHTPLRRAEHIQKAVDTLLLYNADTVLSVYEDYDLHFAHRAHGLEPLNPGMHQKIRLEREALYVDNGAIKVFWRDVLQDQKMASTQKTGHIVMSLEESLRIKGHGDLQPTEEALLKRLPAVKTPLGSP